MSYVPFGIPCSGGKTCLVPAQLITYESINITNWLTKQCCYDISNMLQGKN